MDAPVVLVSRLRRYTRQTAVAFLQGKLVADCEALLSHWPHAYLRLGVMLADGGLVEAAGTGQAAHSLALTAGGVPRRVLEQLRPLKTARMVRVLALLVVVPAGLTEMVFRRVLAVECLRKEALLVATVFAAAVEHLVLRSLPGHQGNAL